MSEKLVGEGRYEIELVIEGNDQFQAALINRIALYLLWNRIG